MDRILQSLSRGAVPIGVVAFAVSNSVYTVYPGQAAVIFDRFQGGIQDTVVGEGTHLRIPWVQTPKIYDVKLKPRVISSATGTKDLQEVSISLRVLSRPQEDRLPEIFQNYGLDYDERVLPSIGNEVLKGVVAQYDAAQLITKRDTVSNQVRTTLIKRANDFGIVLEDVAITHLAFSPEFTRAVEAKQVMYQQAEMQKYVVQKSDQLRKAAVIRAEADAEYARMIQEATRSNPSFVELRQMEALKDIVTKLSESKNVVYLPSQTNVLMNLDGKK